MNKVWKSAMLSEVCSKISDGTHHSPTEQFSEPGPCRFKYVTSKNIRPWGLDLSDIAYLDKSIHREIYSRCNPELGDVLLTKDGANTGNVAINTLDEEFSLLSSVALLKPKREILESRFLRYFLESPIGSKRLLGEMTGTAIRRIILRKIKETEIPIAPLPEQHRIVTEIEKQFTRLDAGVAALRRVQANLKRYRASVLKAACEGRLVATEAELATKRKVKFETGEALLARILTERRKKWTGRGKFKEPTITDVAKLPPLPHGWTWLTVETIGFVTKLAGFEYTKYVKYTPDGDLAVIKAENAGRNGFKPTEISRIKSNTVAHLIRSQLKAGDLLMVFVGAGTGNVARVPNDQPYFLGPNIGRILGSLTSAERYTLVNCRRFQESYITEYLGEIWGINRAAFWKHVEMMFKSSEGLIIGECNEHIEIMCRENMPKYAWMSLLKRLLATRRPRLPRQVARPRSRPEKGAQERYLPWHRAGRQCHPTVRNEHAPSRHRR